jgi:hypothetical protein
VWRLHAIPKDFSNEPRSFVGFPFLLVFAKRVLHVLNNFGHVVTTVVLKFAMVKKIEDKNFDPTVVPKQLIWSLLRDGFSVRAQVSRLQVDGFRPQSSAERSLGNLRLGWDRGDDRVVLVLNSVNQPALDPLGLTRAQFDANPYQTATVALPPPAARIAHKINLAFAAGDLAEAARLQKQFALFPSRWMEWGLAATMKAALRELGIDLGDPFPPYEPVPPAALAALVAHIRSMDF